MADTLILKHHFSDLPALADRNGEAVVNWTYHGACSVVADDTHVYSGSNSFKFHYTVESPPVGDGTYITLASGYNAVFTVGKSYTIAIRVYSTGTTGFRIVTGGVNSGELNCVANQWALVLFTFTASTGTTTFVIHGVDVGTFYIWFEIEEIKENVSLDVLSAKGQDDPDWFELFPAILNTALDGSKETQFKAFRRKTRIDCGVVTDSAKRRGILYWFLDNDRKYDYGTETWLSFVPQREDEYENEWIEDCSLMRRYIFELDESEVRTVFPV